MLMRPLVKSAQIVLSVRPPVAGQAVATAHVPRHAYGPAIYAQQAIYRATNPSEAAAAAAQERDWQYQHLLELGEN